uniref:CR032 protein n=1 Tax=Ascaris lumbricoides TaxID=6252 RepID=A0A0M3HTI7_ASCLU
MVCVPCLILPFLLAIYLKFIQPYVLRLIPEAWRTTFDALLYPTCPARPPPVLEKATKSEETIELSNNSEQACCDQKVREKAD